MYEKFFDLRTKPFDLVPNPDFLYMSRSHKKAMTYLDYGIREKVGFILLTGEVGSGKTTLVKNMIKGLNGKVTLSKVFNTRVSSEQLISMINEDFGLDVEGKDKTTLLRELNDFLIEQYANRRQPILIIDESQNLSPELLEEVRLLSNLETDTSKLLLIILVGQPELRKTLASSELRQLRQRISISCHLLPLTRDEMEHYIFHRLEIAGNRWAVKFPEEVMDIIHAFSRGIPRLVNIICDFLLLSAYAEGTKELSPELVREVVGELELENSYWDDAQALPVQGKDQKSQLESLEDELLMLKAHHDEWADVSERLCAMEKLLINYIGRNQADMAKMEGCIDEIVRTLTLSGNGNGVNGMGQKDARRALLAALKREHNGRNLIDVKEH